MLLNHHLKMLCVAILNERIGNENFGNLLVEAGLKLDNLDEKEWDIANKLLGKGEEISHAVGGLDKRTVH